MAEDNESKFRTALEGLRDNRAAEVDVEHGLTDLHNRTRARRLLTRRSGLVLVAAAAIALVAGSFALLSSEGSRTVVVSGEPNRPATPEAHDPEAAAALAAAVQATRNAPGWVAEVTGGVRTVRIVFQAPDRIDLLNGVEDEFLDGGDRPIRQVVIGTDAWYSDDGGWVKGQTDWRTVAPFTLLDALSSACVAETDDGFIARGSTDGCDKGQLSDEDKVWLVKVAAGRLYSVTSGTPGSSAAAKTTSTGQSNEVIDPPNVGRRDVTTFTYDNTPPVTVPPGQ